MSKTEYLNRGSIGQEFRHTNYHKYNQGVDQIFGNTNFKIDYNLKNPLEIKRKNKSKSH